MQGRLTVITHRQRFDVTRQRLGHRDDQHLVGVLGNKLYPLLGKSRLLQVMRAMWQGNAD